MSSINFSIYLEFKDKNAAQVAADVLKRQFWLPYLKNASEIKQQFEQLGMTPEKLLKFNMLTQWFGEHQIMMNNGVVDYFTYYGHRRGFQPFVDCFRCLMNLNGVTAYGEADNDANDGELYLYNHGEHIYYCYTDYPMLLKLDSWYKSKLPPPETRGLGLCKALDQQGMFTGKIDKVISY